MDPNYAAVASDINRLLPEQYECINVTPVRRNRTWDENGKEVLHEGYTPVHNTSIAEYVGVHVVVKDDYRESWWNAIGGQPQVMEVYSPHLFNESAGVAGHIVRELICALDEYIEDNRPESRPYPSKAASNKGAKKKKTTTK